MRVLETIHAEPKSFVDSPIYRVNFWQQPVPEGAWMLDAYILVDVKDINEVIFWVGEHSQGRRFEIFAEVEEWPVGRFGVPRKTGLLRLLGNDPNEEGGVTVKFGEFTEE
ncbi:hypothetical protein [Kocuria sp. KH4]